MDTPSEDTRKFRRRGFVLDTDHLTQSFQSKGWSQLDLARKSGLDPRTIAKIRKGGACDAKTLQLLAETLCIPPADLLLDRPKEGRSSQSTPEMKEVTAQPGWSSCYRILQSWKIIDLRSPLQFGEVPCGIVWEHFRIQKVGDTELPLVFPYLTWGDQIDYLSDCADARWKRVEPQPGDLVHSQKLWELEIDTESIEVGEVFETGPHRLCYQNAFHAAGQQWWQTRVAYDVESLVLQILFDKEHPCKTLRSDWAPPGQNRFVEHPDERPFLLSDGTIVHWNLLRPPVGSFYRLAWTW